ncbi:MAG: hypothetical protein D6798_03605 [Deltaproteobacteria bacterium]|nr:MAG: hypothetical protein D6798_03605 [Deltaproteobacteria bacterium]
MAAHSSPRHSSTGRAATIGGAIAAAIAASACCIGPLILAVLGIGGAGFLVALEPYRPLFTAITIVLLGAGWILTWRERARSTVAVTASRDGGGADGDDCGCAMPRANRTGKRMMWLATAIVGVALLFPYLTPYLF